MAAARDLDGAVPVGVGRRPGRPAVRPGELLRVGRGLPLVEHGDSGELLRPAGRVVHGAEAVRVGTRQPAGGWRVGRRGLSVPLSGRGAAGGLPAVGGLPLGGPPAGGGPAGPARGGVPGPGGRAGGLLRPQGCSGRPAALPAVRLLLHARCPALLALDGDADRGSSGEPGSHPGLGSGRGRFHAPVAPALGLRDVPAVLSRPLARHLRRRPAVLRPLSHRVDSTPRAAHRQAPDEDHRRPRGRGLDLLPAPRAPVPRGLRPRLLCDQPGILCDAPARAHLPEPETHGAGHDRVARSGIRLDHANARAVRHRSVVCHQVRVQRLPGGADVRHAQPCSDRDGGVGLACRGQRTLATADARPGGRSAAPDHRRYAGDVPLHARPLPGASRVRRSPL